MARKLPAKKAKKKTLSPSERKLVTIKLHHTNAIRRIFSAVGFRRVTGLSDKEFTFEHQKSDLDDVFVYENVIVLVEYTCSQNSDVGGHLKNKKLVYDKIIAKPAQFVAHLKAAFPAAASQLQTGYHASQDVLKIVYCSRYDFDDIYRTNVPGPVYLNYPEVRYFISVVGAIKRSARHEFLHFLKIEPNKVGKGGAINASSQSRDYKGSILPEAHSNFDAGYKVVSFYADADALLRTAYVLRKDGWRDSNNLYQRMISDKKIESIRAYLKKNKRVFINNIIVTLPPDVHPLSPDKKTIDASTLSAIEPIIIQIPDRPNSVGIIDGQHRVFAYHETETDDKQIAQLRVQQNLLVTGIIYPQDLSTAEREKFEAKLFLEINSTQTNAKAPLKQAIGLVIDPFTNDSIATRILNGLAKQGPLKGIVQQYFWDTDKLKTASIVSYGLKPLVKTSGTDSLFALWKHADKEKVAKGTDLSLLEDYINFCVTTINIVLGAIKTNLAANRWTANKKIPGKVISTTYINSFLIVIRLLIEKKAKFEFEPLRLSLVGLDKFQFTTYRSSQYRRMAEEIVKIHFKSPPATAAPKTATTKPRSTKT